MCGAFLCGSVLECWCDLHYASRRDRGKEKEREREIVQQLRDRKGKYAGNAGVLPHTVGIFFLHPEYIYGAVVNVGYIIPRDAKAQRYQVCSQASDNLHVPHDHYWNYTIQSSRTRLV